MPANLTQAPVEENGVTTSKFEVMVDALNALPGPITRKGLLDQLRATETFDADGFLGAVPLGKRLSNGCQLAVIVKGGKRTRLAPSKGFLC